MQQSENYHGFEIVEVDTGFVVAALGATFGTIEAARQAIDDHLAKPKKEIPLVDDAAADSLEQENAMPLPELPPPQPRMRH